MAAMTLVLAACGGSGAGTTTQPESATTIDVSAIPEGRGVVTDNADGSRTVTWNGGSAVVPAEPQRIVTVIGDIDLESLLFLGMTPVGSGTQDGTVQGGFAPHIESLTGEVEPLPWTDGYAYEAIAALEPDVIFSWDDFEALSEIAPTVPSGSWIGPEWREDFLYVAAVVGMSDEADQALDEFEQRMGDVGSEIAATVDGKTVATGQVAGDHSQVWLNPEEDFASSVLGDLGMSLAGVTAEPIGENGWVSLSFESIDQIDADILFWQVRQTDGGAPDEEGLALVTENPLWDSIPAVTDDQVHYVENRPWYFPTILGAQRIVDDVEAALAS
jgi:iron complex transport system substrate-binding protein